MRIDAFGNVGIGISDMDGKYKSKAKLVVDDSIAISSSIRTNNLDSGPRLLIKGLRSGSTGTGGELPFFVLKQSKQGMAGTSTSGSMSSFELTARRGIGEGSHPLDTGVTSETGELIGFHMKTYGEPKIGAFMDEGNLDAFAEAPHLSLIHI